MYRTELVCSRRCGYQCAVGNGVYSAFRRTTPDECRQCGADLVNP